MTTESRKAAVTLLASELRFGYTLMLFTNRKGVSLMAVKTMTLSDDVNLTTLLPETRLFERLETDQLAVGCYTYSGPRRVVEMLGEAGLDFVVVDLMGNPTSWETAATLASTAYQFGMTPWVRLSSYPWSSKVGVVDPRVQADVFMALSVGFQVVQVSINSPEQIAAALEVRLDNHRRTHLRSWDRATHSGSEQAAAFGAALEARTLIVPSIECEPGLAQFDEIIALPGLRLLKFCMGDLLQVLGHSGELEHPDVKTIVRESVMKAAKYGVGISVNMPAKYTPEAVHETARWLRDEGVAACEIPGYPWILHTFYHDTLSLVRTIDDA